MQGSCQAAHSKTEAPETRIAAEKAATAPGGYRHFREVKAVTDAAALAQAAKTLRAWHTVPGERGCSLEQAGRVTLRGERALAREVWFRDPENSTASSVSGNH